MAWTNAISNLRTLLSDNSTDKLRAFKKPIGIQDGLNTTFKTVEFRRVTDFTDQSMTFPLGIYINNAQISPRLVTLDDTATGYFQLDSTITPSNTDLIECSYYVQWFMDSEMADFLTNAANWIGNGGDYTLIDPGLQPAAKHYAASDAYMKLALKFAEHMSETYRVEDIPSEKRFDIVESYRKASVDNKKIALDLRNDFYSRKGQSLAPLFNIANGSFRSVEPKA